MTKEELRKELESGTPLSDALLLSQGQECLIFKADYFSLEDVIYIPDVSLNELQCYRPASEEEIEEIISCCYTGKDFVEEVGGDEGLARTVFYECDWQHPSTLVSEMENTDCE